MQRLDRYKDDIIGLGRNYIHRSGHSKRQRERGSGGLLLIQHNLPLHY